MCFLLALSHKGTRIIYAQPRTYIVITGHTSTAKEGSTLEHTNDQLLPRRQALQHLSRRDRAWPGPAGPLTIHILFIFIVPDAVTVSVLQPHRSARKWVVCHFWGARKQDGTRNVAKKSTGHARGCSDLRTSLYRMQARVKRARSGQPRPNSRRLRAPSVPEKCQPRAASSEECVSLDH